MGRTQAVRKHYKRATTTTTTGFVLYPDMRKKCEAEAERREMSLSVLLREIIREYFEQREAKKDMGA